MNWIKTIDVGLRKVAYPDGLRSFYDITWESEDGVAHTYSTQNFYEMVAFLKFCFVVAAEDTAIETFNEIWELMQREMIDPRTDEDMEEMYT